MLAKKPYLLFIKHFKFFNLILTILMGYLIYIDNKMINFFNKYIEINDTNVSMIESVNTNLLIIIPILIFLLSFIILSILVKKNKPIKLYLLVIFSIIAIIVINIHVIGFIETISKEIVIKRSIKLSRDLKLISIILELICCLPLFIRSIGFNLKKMDFSSKSSKFNFSIEDEDNYEIIFNFNLDKIKKNIKKKKIYLKYFYSENKFKINIFIVIFTIFIVLLFNFTNLKFNTSNYGIENKFYNKKDFFVKVNSSYYSNNDYLNNIISDNYIVIVKLTMRSSNKILLNEFSLKINDIVFKPVDKYYKQYIDLGNGYKEKISNEDKDYIIIFEIPKKYINKKMFFNISDISIKLNLINLDNNKKEEYVLKKGEESNIDGLKFVINDYEIKNEFVLKYDFCYKESNCVKSFEHLRASINENYDKVLLRLNAVSDSNLYDIINNYATIVYTKNGIEYSQRGEFELVKSKKNINQYNNIYIGVNKEIINSDNIKIEFVKRNVKLIYILDGDI